MKSLRSKISLFLFHGFFVTKIQLRVAENLRKFINTAYPMIQVDLFSETIGAFCGTISRNSNAKILLSLLRIYIEMDICIILRNLRVVSDLTCRMQLR